jgi:hypothetical protein
MKQASKVPFNLPDFALPFVTRSMRGGRGKRYVALSGLLALFTLLMGTWMALGEGPMERDLRVSLDLEDSVWERQENEFVIIAQADWEVDDLEHEVRAIRAIRDADRKAFFEAAGDPNYYESTSNSLNHYSRVGYVVRSAYEDVERAAKSVPPNRHARVLRDRAAAYLGVAVRSEADMMLDEYAVQEYAWHSPDAVERLESILDHDLLPQVERYSSPLDAFGAIKFIGAFAAWLLAVLALVVAPTSTAIQHAREVHNNTLQPLTGTAFSPKELTRGLRAGYLAPLAIFAIPLMALTTASALIAGNLFALLCMALILASGGYALVSLAHLFAHIAGHRRTPGMVGVGIMGLVGMSGFIGMIMGFEADDELLGALGAVPQAGFTFMQRWTFGNELDFEPFAVLAVFVGAIAWLIIGALVTQVISKRVAGSEGPALSRWRALVGAGVSAALVTMAFAPIVSHGHVSREEPTIFFFAGLMALAIPYAALLMARVPMSEAPTTMRKLPLAPLMGELFAMVGLYSLITIPFIGEQAFNILLSPVAIFYAAWGIAVVGLVAVRSAVAAPQRIWTHLGIAYCMLCVLVAGVHATIWAMPFKKADGDELVLMWQLSPILGMLQLVCIFAVPLLLIRGLRLRFASLR